MFEKHKYDLHYSNIRSIKIIAYSRLMQWRLEDKSKSVLLTHDNVDIDYKQIYYCIHIGSACIAWWFEILILFDHELIKLPSDIIIYDIVYLIHNS